jgi:hypothetical protein
MYGNDNKQNTYGQQSPYDTNNHSYQNNHNNDNGEKRRIEEKRKKHESLQRAQDAIDNIVKVREDAHINEIEFTISAADKAKIVRHYKKYWNLQAQSLSLLVLVLSFLVSFFSIFALFGIAIIPLIQAVYSQETYMRKLLNDHDTSEKEGIAIKELIFGSSFRFSKWLIIGITLVLMAIAFVSFHFSSNIFIDPASTDFVKINKFLTKFTSFSSEHELFAYINAISIMILMFMKTIEKWYKRYA